MSSCRLVIPLLNRKVATFSGPVWALSTKASVQRIQAPDFQILCERVSWPRDFSKHPSIRCLYVQEAQLDQIEAFVKREAAKTRFTFNMFADAEPILMTFAAVIVEHKKPRVDRIIEFDTFQDERRLQSREYRIKRGTSRRHVSSLYERLTSACSSKPEVWLTLERFNSGLTRSALQEWTSRSAWSL
jgi:hypothetical protein